MNTLTLQTITIQHLIVSCQYIYETKVLFQLTAFGNISFTQNHSILYFETYAKDSHNTYYFDL